MLLYLVMLLLCSHLVYTLPLGCCLRMFVRGAWVEAEAAKQARSTFMAAQLPVLL